MRYVDRDKLAGRDFLVVKDGEHLAVFLARDAIEPHVIEAAWDAVRECSRNVALVAPILPRDRRGIPYVPARTDLRLVGGR